MKPNVSNIDKMHLIEYRYTGMVKVFVGHSCYSQFADFFVRVSFFIFFFYSINERKYDLNRNEFDTSFIMKTLFFLLLFFHSFPIRSSIIIK